MADNLSISPNGNARLTGKGIGNKTSVALPKQPNTSIGDVNIQGKIPLDKEVSGNDQVEVITNKVLPPFKKQKHFAVAVDNNGNISIDDDVEVNYGEGSVWNEETQQWSFEYDDFTTMAYKQFENLIGKNEDVEQFDKQMYFVVSVDDNGIMEIEDYVSINYDSGSIWNEKNQEWESACYDDDDAFVNDATAKIEGLIAKNNEKVIKEFATNNDSELIAERQSSSNSVIFAGDDDGDLDRCRTQCNCDTDSTRR